MIKIRRYLRGEKGFTLVEMMVVLIIIAVLIAGGIYFYLGYIGRAHITKAEGDISTIQAALDSYYASNQTYPKVDDVTSLQAAGISTSMATSTPTASIPYVITSNTSGNGYCIYTVTSYNGTWVEGTGLSGISTKPVTTNTTFNF
jgi:general secretion pathway protein G